MGLFVKAAKDLARMDEFLTSENQESHNMLGRVQAFKAMSKCQLVDLKASREFFQVYSALGKFLDS